MLMKRIIISVVLFLSTLVLAKAQDVSLTINFTGFIPNEGTVNIMIVNEQDTQEDDKEPFFSDTFDATTTDLEYKVSLPEGYYFITVFQDLNENEELDMNFLKIPKEPIGMSNYEFKGIPGGFDKHKFYVSSEENEITIIVKKI